MKQFSNQNAKSYILTSLIATSSLVRTLIPAKQTNLHEIRHKAILKVNKINIINESNKPK